MKFVQNVVEKVKNFIKIYRNIVEKLSKKIIQIVKNGKLLKVS